MIRRVTYPEQWFAQSMHDIQSPPEKYPTPPKKIPLAVEVEIRYADEKMRDETNIALLASD